MQSSDRVIKSLRIFAGLSTKYLIAIWLKSRLKQLHISKIFVRIKTSGRSAPLVLGTVPHTQMLVTAPDISHNP